MTTYRLSNFALALLRGVRRKLRRTDFLDQVSAPPSMQLCTRKTCPQCSQRRHATSTLRIVFLCFAATHPSGGIKVIYRQAQLIADMGFDCVVFHPEEPAFSAPWFNHRANIERCGHFDPHYDFLVLPELMATVAARFCLMHNVRYAVYVQNGYILQGFGNRLAAELTRAYEKANLILSISDDTATAVKLAFPRIAPATMLRMRLSVRDVFRIAEKTRTITYMPRKLKDHARLLKFFLMPHLPAGWTLQPIHNANEDQVADMLSKSSIFLSFSHMEGLGLPPIEAALAGNVVVGYTGEGGKEFFQPPIFRAIENGNFISYVHAILGAISDVEAGRAKGMAFAEQCAQLRQTYSAERELESIHVFLRRAQSAMAGEV